MESGRQEQSSTVYPHHFRRALKTS